jgi:uncharacterized phage protein (TIGR02220 family)
MRHIKTFLLSTNYTIKPQGCSYLGQGRTFRNDCLARILLWSSVMSGWIKLHRNIISWEWSSKPGHVAVFLHLLLRANYRKTTWRKQVINAGQIVTGRRQLSVATGLSEAQIRVILNDLESSREITRESFNRFSVITIVNWIKYQVNEEDNFQTSQQTTSEIAGELASEIATSKKYNKYNNKIIPSVSSASPLDEERIISLLNAECNKNYRPVLSNTKHIKARLHEGYQLEDFEKVIKTKKKSWGENPDMKKYLRPETLFGAKFDSYLQETPEETIEDLSWGKFFFKYDTNYAHNNIPGSNA